MKILITGAKGQVGTDLVLEAKKRDHQVYGFTSSELDITDKNVVSNTINSIKPDVVINAAAYTAVDKAETEKKCAYAVNENGVKNLAEACKALDIPLLHISTDYVFDGDKKEPYVETDIPDPASVYGASKLAGEIALQKTWHKHIILRVSWVFGAHGNNFVKTMLRVAASRAELSVVDDQLGAPTSSMAISRVFLKILASDRFGEEKFPWGLYHYSGAPAVSWYAFAIEIFERAESQKLIESSPLVHPITTKEYPTPAARPANSVLNFDHIGDTLAIDACDWQADLNYVLTAITEP